MIIIEFAGGLGNQLQQYALSKKLISLGAEVKLDLSWFKDESQEKQLYKRKCELLRLDGVSFDECTEAEKKNVIENNKPIVRAIKKLRRKLSEKLPSVFPQNINKIREFKESKMYHDELIRGVKENPNIDLYIRGYFACEYYYADILDGLRNEIGFPIEREHKSGQLMDAEYRNIINITNEIRNTNSASIHIRRGDYLDAYNYELFKDICTDEYYEAAVGFVIDSLGAEFAKSHENFLTADMSDVEVNAHNKITFYIFSDDIAYAEEYAEKQNEKFGEKNAEFKSININSGENSLYDLYLMSLCKNNICANSTFSFWGARLNKNPDKIMTRPAKHRNNQPFIKENMINWWQGWTLIKSDGEVVKP